MHRSHPWREYKKAATSAPSKEDVLNGLLRSHEAYFDVSRDYAYAGRSFAGYAEFRSHSEQFVLVKRAKLWEADAFEYIFFDVVDTVDSAWADEAFRFMTTEAIGKVDPRENHMMSFVSLVAIADSVTDDARARIRKARFRKNFKLGFRGWVDLRMAAIDLSAMDVATNGMGKEMKPTLLSCLQAAQACKHDGNTAPLTDTTAMPLNTERKKEEVELS